MPNLGEFNKTSATRPYWLLLALALFFAGQIAAASHWHNDNDAFGHQSSLDVDCALCVLSSAAGAAAVTNAINIASIALCIFLAVYRERIFVSSRLYSYQSRAPPF